MTTHDPLQLIGTLLDGKYQVEDLVNETWDANGILRLVYRAHHTTLKHPVVVKCLWIPWSVRPDVRAAFQCKHEAQGRTLRSLSKLATGMVCLLDAGEVVRPTGGWVPYFVFEWFDGESLENVLTKRREEGLGGRPLGEVIQWLDGPAQVLAIAHAHGVAHRNIKPANLLVVRPDDRDSGCASGVPTIKILDFCIPDLAEATRDRPHGVIALPDPDYCRCYASEQFELRDLGLRARYSDVYAFAIIAIELLTDRRAFECEELLDLMMRVFDPQVRPTPRSKGVQVGDRVEAVFARALRVNPDERFQNIGEFWTAL